MLAYCSGVNVPLVPSGLVNLIKELLVASVSSKSNILIPFVGFLVDLENLLIVSILFKALIDLDFFNDVFIELANLLPFLSLKTLEEVLKFVSCNIGAVLNVNLPFSLICT